MLIKSFKSLLCIAVALFAYQEIDACTNILVSRGASKDGSTFISYAADSHQLYGEVYFHPAGIFKSGSMLDIYEWDTGRFMGKIPQLLRTYQTVGNMNEHQVMITETTYGGRHELLDTTGIVDYGSLIYVTLQRAKTAREAIKIMTDMVAEYGYGSGGESFSVGDKNEVWILEMIGKGVKLDSKGNNIRKGAVWVAARVPEGYICAHANQARIDKINFNDHENWLYASDVVSFAREMGYFEGKDADFSFCDAYAPIDFGGMRGCEARVWSAFNILGDGRIGECAADDYLDFAMGYNAAHKMPLFIKPAKPITMKDVADVMRDHYEGTPMDMTTDAGAGGNHCPYRWRPMDFEWEGATYVNERAIATQQTGFWIVCQGRSWLPDEVGGILWFGVDDAATSCLTPVYTSITRIPECVRVGNGNMLTYSPTSLFWLTNRITNFAYLIYDRLAPEIQAKADAIETACMEEVKGIDARALKILGDKPGKKQHEEVRAYLTDYTETTAQKLFSTWQNLDQYLLVKYIDGNVKKQNPDGSFKSNGESPVIPAFPTQPGYSDVWKKAVIDSNGETLKVK